MPADPPELPEDVLRVVAEHVARTSRDSLWALAQTSRALREICVPIAFRRRTVAKAGDLDLPGELFAHVEELVLVTCTAFSQSAVARAPRLRRLIIRVQTGQDASQLAGVLGAAGARDRVLDSVAVVALQLLSDGDSSSEGPRVGVRDVILMGSDSTITSVFRLIDTTIIRRLVIANVVEMPAHLALAPSAPHLPALRVLDLRWVGASPLPFISPWLSVSRVERLRIPSTPDAHAELLALLHGIAAEHRKLRELIVMLGSGSDVVPWLELDRCADALKPLESLKRLNASDGFYSPGGAADARPFFARLPTLRQVVFSGQSAHSLRKAFGRGEGIAAEAQDAAEKVVVPVELAHDDEPWERSVGFG